MSRLSNRGFGLIELMVAITLSLILIGGALSVLYSSKVAYNENERVGRLQENGRAALELMVRDMRASGFHGCAQTIPFDSTLNTPTELLWNFANPVQGYEYTGPATWSPALDPIIASPLDGSDVMAVRTVRTNMPSFVTSAAMASTNDAVSISRAPSESVAAGQPVLISDCKAAVVFGVSAFTAAGTAATLSHAAAAAAGAGPGNATDDLGFEFSAGAQVVPVDTVIYYIRPSNTTRNGVNNPALWRIVGSSAPEELIEGIERMQIQYGVDTNGDRIVDDYVTADAVTNWSRVISVSFALLIRSIEPNSAEPAGRTYSMLGTNVGPFNDRYQRTLYTTTVALRNETS